MAKSWTVYRHISPSGKVYIGITSREVIKRWNNGNNYKMCSIFQKAILKYGWDNIKHQVLFTNLTERRAKDLEVDLIRHYKNLAISYNITDGGDGMLGVSPNQETRDKISKSNKGREPYNKGLRLSDRTKDKISQSRLGKYKGEENPNYGNHKLSGKNHPFYGKTHSEETKRRISNSRKGKSYLKPTDIQNLILRNKNRMSIRIEQIDKNTLEVVKIWDNAVEAAKELCDTNVKVASNHIRECCRGKRKSTLNYYWRNYNG